MILIGGGGPRAAPAGTTSSTPALRCCLRRESIPPRSHAAGHPSVSTYDRYGHLFPEVDVGAATKPEALRNYRLQTGAEVY
jgi:hypothetical protein